MKETKGNESEEEGRKQKKQKRVGKLSGQSLPLSVSVPLVIPCPWSD